jgi:hypothetical protein
MRVAETLDSPSVLEDSLSSKSDATLPHMHSMPVMPVTVPYNQYEIDG